MRFLIPKFIFILPCVAFSQTLVKGVICNSKKIALPFTNVVSIKKYNGTSTNEKGEFMLSNNTDDDTLKITNVAFYPKLVAVKTLDKIDTIFLEENIKELEEVVVRNFRSFKQEQTLGFLEYKNNAEFKLMPGNQMAIFIENKAKRQGWIKDISFNVKKSGSCKNSIRVRLLQSDSLGIAPSLDLLNENVVLNSNELKKVTHIDISNYKILFPPDGVFVVLEWVASDKKCDKNSFTSISANMAVPQNLVWLNFRDKLWGHNNRPRLPNGNYMTPNISIKIAY